MWSSGNPVDVAAAAAVAADPPKTEAATKGGTNKSIKVSARRFDIRCGVPSLVATAALMVSGIRAP